MRLHPFAYVECETVVEAVEALGTADDARIIAGGTVVVPLMKHDLLRPDSLVSVLKVQEMQMITSNDESVFVGACVSHASVVKDIEIARHAPILAQACSLVASPTIRSMGTIGGNLCYGESASDPSPVLLVLGAVAHVVGPGGPREIAIEDFFRGFYDTALEDDEVLVRIEVPHGDADQPWAYLKWTPREKEDNPLTGLAVRLGSDTASARLAVGGIDATPRLLRLASEAIEPGPLTASSIAAAAEAAASEVDPIDDLQGSASYRRDMLRIWVRRALEDLKSKQESK